MDVSAMSLMAGAAPVTAPTVSPAPTSPDDLVAERFSEALNAGPVAQPTATPAAAAAGATPKATLGDAILAGIDGMSSQLRTSWEVVHNQLPVQGHTPSISELLVLQTHVVHFSFLYDLVGKGVSKSVQDLDGLVRTQ